MCARGSDYAFWVRPGETDRLVIDFMGGGARWDETTCALQGTGFEDGVEDLRRVIDGGFSRGIYDHKNPENPFALDWHVIVAYCTGDIHWGNATVQLGDSGAGVITDHFFRESFSS